MSIEITNRRWGSGVFEKLFVNAKVGGTSGWVVNAGADSWMSTCPASQTASTLVVPLQGVQVGDQIRGYHLLGQIDSAGNTVTVDAQLYEFAAAVGGSATAAKAGTSITQVSVTADTLVNAGTANINFAETDYVFVEADKTYFVLITATTGATTDIELLGVAGHIKALID